MKELSREASLLVSAGRQAFEPTEADRARLMATLTGAATVSVGLGVATGAQRIWEWLFGLSRTVRWAAVALPAAAAGGAIGLHALQTSPAHEVARLSATRQASAIGSAAAARRAPVIETLAPTRSDEPLAPAAPERTSAPVSETKRDREIREEVALLSKAQTALSKGRPQEALAALAEHAQRFPRGVLTEERAATRARTLCALGRTQEAQAELKRIAKLNPTSAYLARARESCGLP